MSMTQVGLAYKTELESVVQRAIRRGLIDALEIVADPYLFFPRAFEQITDSLLSHGLPCSLHFISSSLGSADFAQNNSCSAFLPLIRKAKPFLISEHLTCLRSGEIDLEMNLPVPKTEEMIEVFAENIAEFKRILKFKTPFLVENVPAYWEYTSSTLSHAEFFKRVVERADCGMLLDLHNLYADELNIKQDAEAFIRALPGDRIEQIHIAGGHWVGKTYYDGHSSEVPKRVFELLKLVLRKSRPKLIVLEREQRYRNLDTIFNDLTEVRRLCQNAQGKPFRRLSTAA